MEQSIGEVIQKLIKEKDDAERHLSEAKMIYQNNINLVVQEREEYRMKLRIAQSEKVISDEKISNLQKLYKLSEKEVERLKKEVVQHRMHLKNYKEKVEKSGKDKEKRYKPVPVKEYDSLRNATVMSDRVGKGITALGTIAGQTTSKFFYRHVCDSLDKQQLQKLKFTAYEGFQMYHNLNFTRSQLCGLKKWLKNFNMYDPFPSLRSIKEVEERVGSKELFTVKQKELSNGNGVVKKVTYAYLNNVQQAVNDRVQQMFDSEKLEFDESTKDGIWVAILGDKGGDEVKLCIAIGNTSTPNSANNLLPIGIYNDEETAEKVLEYLGSAIEELNQLVDVEVKIGDEIVRIPVQQFLVGDMKFIYEMIGHQGASATCSCMYCYSPGRQKISNYKRGENCRPRTEIGYALDSLKSGTSRKSVKECSSFIFKRVPLERIVPSSLHIVMGLAQTYGFNIIKQLADDQDAAESTPLPKSSMKLKKEGKAEVEGAEKRVIECDTHLNSMECVHKSYENILLNKIDDSGLDDGECASKLCVYKDSAMDCATFFNANTVKCNGCQKTHHYVCAGAWTIDEVEEIQRPGSFVQCFDCVGLTPPKILESSEKLVDMLKLERIRLFEQSEQVRKKYEKRLEVWKGNGDTRKRLEKIWTSLGADISARKQDFSGNHTLKLLDEAAVEEYCSILEQTPQLSHIKGFLINLGKFQKLCVSREMSDDEIESMEIAIDNIWTHLQQFAGHLNVTPKLHVLLEHTADFVKTHKTLARISEQCIEGIHAIVNRLKQRFRTDRDESRRVNFVFCSLLFNCHVFSTC
ncbi:hypothetical protein GCK72_002877 [Caenorhabditis remanei]|uniref:Zinc finger PHD-type domain-containing protein n=1 Tax=Caenorhabditis remanei TaxID=31234 RepID=A0A6A5HY31_CAERE|nr:hypothetical protein GCK72_002877 [Caenorhabditis remanei]KAF1771052.1 hypothetical protein GCK72_002877 [Caenorhabditis remanei]